MVCSLLVAALSTVALSAANAFVAPPLLLVRSIAVGTFVPSRSLMAVVDVDSEAEFDKKISSAGTKLVVIDYSTTWCGPCKVIAPKFDQLSEAYPDSVFIKVRLVVQYPPRREPSVSSLIGRFGTFFTARAIRCPFMYSTLLCNRLMSLSIPSRRQPPTYP